MLFVHEEYRLFIPRVNHGLNFPRSRSARPSSKTPKET